MTTEVWSKLDPTAWGGTVSQAHADEPPQLAENQTKAAMVNEYERIIRALEDRVQDAGRGHYPIASSTTPAIGADAYDYLMVTGTTTITGFDSAAPGTMRELEFAGVLTFTNGAKLGLPGAANITTVAGDRALMRCKGDDSRDGVTAGDYWECVRYTPVGGFPLFGGIQAVYDSDGEAINVTNNAIPFDDTKPENDEGGEIITVAITPKYSDSVLLFWVMTMGQAYANSRIVTIALFKDSEQYARSASPTRTSTATAASQYSLQHKAVASGVAEEVWKVRLGTNTASGGVDIYVNQDSGPTDKYDGVCETSLIIQEVRV